MIAFAWRNKVGWFVFVLAILIGGTWTTVKAEEANPI
jgi:hypothetical protein